MTRTFSGLRSLFRPINRQLARSSAEGTRDDGPVDDVVGVQRFQSTEQLGGVEPAPLLVEPALLLQVVEQFASVDKGQDQIWARSSQAPASGREGKGDGQSLSGLWKENLSGTMKGLFTWPSTVRSASVWVTSDLETMCAFRIVLRA